MIYKIVLNNSSKPFKLSQKACDFISQRATDKIKDFVSSYMKCNPTSNINEAYNIYFGILSQRTRMNSILVECIETLKKEASNECNLIVDTFEGYRFEILIGNGGEYLNLLKDYNEPENANEWLEEKAFQNDMPEKIDVEELF